MIRFMLFTVLIYNSSVRAAMTEEARNVLVCMTTLESALAGVLPDAKMIFNSRLDQPQQIVTTDQNVLASGAISAVVIPNGKVIQIMPNGSCMMSDKGFNSLYDFLGKQMERHIIGNRRLELSAQDEKDIQNRCDKLPFKAPFLLIRDRLVRDKLLKQRQPTAEEQKVTGAT